MNTVAETHVVAEAHAVAETSIFTPHESLPVPRDCNRQFLRIVSAGVHGREDYFTENEFGPATAAA